MAQSVKCQTLDLSSDPNFGVVSSSSTLGCALGMEPTLKKMGVRRPAGGALTPYTRGQLQPLLL